MVKFSAIKGTPEYRPGLGYSPASGPKVGGPIYPPGNFFEYDINDLLPTGRKLSKFGSRGDVNLRTFPQLGAYPGEVGPGNTPGGLGGINGPILYGTNTLLARQMGYGRKRKSRKVKRKSRKSRKSRKVKRKSRRLKRKSRKVKRKSRKVKRGSKSKK